MIGAGRRVAGEARAPIAAPHLRQDPWWVLPLTVFVVFTAFVVYATWAAFQNAHYYVDPYLSPFYSPCVYARCLHPTFGPGRGLPELAVPLIGIVSPAILILWGPGIFRLTCYYYRKAYYRSFWLAPPACGVRDAAAGYTGETRFPLILQAFHRYTWYVALVFLGFLAWDALLALVSRLNERHPSFAWLSLCSVALTDLYIRLVSAGLIHDVRIL